MTNTMEGQEDIRLADVIMGRAKALAELQAERERQITIHGYPDIGYSWYGIVLGEEFGEFCRSCLIARSWARNAGREHEDFIGTMLGDMREIRTEACHVAAVALAIMEMVDRDISNATDTSGLEGH